MPAVCSWYNVSSIQMWLDCLFISSKFFPLLSKNAQLIFLPFSSGGLKKKKGVGGKPSTSFLVKSIVGFYV